MHTERGLDRLLTFIDAIVAIAITLLVLPLVDLLGEEPHDDLGALIGDHLADFGSFALSFVVIARLWLVHHRLGEWVGGYDRAFLWVNLGWAFTIVVLPFSSGVVAAYGTQRLSVALYIGTITASSAATAVLTAMLRSRESLRDDEVAAEDVALGHAVVSTGLVALALVVGVAVPAVNFYALLLLLLSAPVERIVDRVLRRG